MKPDPTGPDVSLIALNRLVEERAANDRKYRRTLEHEGRPVLSRARAMPDADLIGKLARLGLDVDRESLSRMAEDALSAEEIYRRVIPAGARRASKDPHDADWAWLALTVLWERWLPERPSFERLDDRIQAGYDLTPADPAGACEQWRLAWEDFLGLFEQGGFTSIEGFDQRFRGSQFVSNWVQDFEMEMSNAARKDPRWHARRIAVCDEYLRRFSGESDLTAENMRRALAEATFQSEGSDRGDRLYEQWLAEDPRWGWGWIGWADNYFLLDTGAEGDLPRAEALLRRGLAGPEVRDREDILERLAEVCREQGRLDEGGAIQTRSDAIRSQSRHAAGSTLSLKTKFEFGEEGLPLDQLPNLTAEVRGEHERVLQSALPSRAQKVGRNDPCPCGSGKKFKKCCGA